MNMFERAIPAKFLITAAAVLFVITAIALYREGLIGMTTPFKTSIWTWQYFADLVIALGIVMVWIWRDCRHRGKSPFPWIIATFLTGSFAPLAYLYFRSQKNSESQ